MITSSAVPETTPSWPRRDTAFASVQFETPAPMPPWMIFGSTDTAGLSGLEVGRSQDITGNGPRTEDSWIFPSPKS